jgi:hypothetical protein
MLNCWFSWKPDTDDRYIIGKVFPFEDFDEVSTEMVRRNFDGMETVYLHISDTERDHNSDFVVPVSGPVFPLCGIDSRVAATIKCSDFDITSKSDIALECHLLLKKCIKIAVENDIKSTISDYCNHSDGYLNPHDIIHAYYNACNEIEASYGSFRRAADELNKA